MTQNRLPRRIVTDAQVARFWRRVFLGQAVLLVATASAAWVVYTQFRGRFDNWLEPMIAVPVVLLCHWLALIGRVPLPALDWRARPAVVTSAAEQRGDDDTPAFLLVKLRVEDTDETGNSEGNGFNATLADMVSMSEDRRFRIGSIWMVHVFQQNHSVAALAEDHEQVRREGYDLLPIGRGRTMYPPSTGSKLLKRRFREH